MHARGSAHSLANMHPLPLSASQSIKVGVRTARADGAGQQLHIAQVAVGVHHISIPAKAIVLDAGKRECKVHLPDSNFSHQQLVKFSARLGCA